MLFTWQPEFTWDHSSGQTALEKEVHTNGPWEWFCYSFFLLSSNSPPSQPNLAHADGREKSPGAGIIMGWSRLRCLDHAIRQKRHGTWAASNTTSTTEIQLGNQNPLSKSLYTRSWVNSASVHPTDQSFPAKCDVQKLCVTNNAMYLWKSPGDQTCRPGHLFVPLPPRCTLWMSSSMSWHGSSVWLSLDVCYHWSSTLKCLDRASRLALSSSCNVARWQAVSALLCI